MSRKSPKKVTKITQRPRTLGKNYEVIKHFIPRSNSNILPLNGHYQIPEINLEDLNECENTLRNPVRRKPIKPKEKPITDKKKAPGSNPQVKCLIKPQYKSSSSSSVEDRLEKFNNIKKSKVRLERPRIRKRSKSNLEGTSFKPKNNSLKSLTDPILIEKQSQVQSIKKEILDNRKMIESNYDNKWGGDNSHVQSIRNELFERKNKNILNRKILITELKTEIAEYKRYNMYHIYNQHEIAQSPDNDNKLCCNDNSEQYNVNTVDIKNNGLAKEKNVQGCCVKDLSKQVTDESSTTSVQGNHELPMGKINAYAELVGDDVIKQKIEDANVLIEKVKKALGKIKTIKPVNVEDYAETSNDSSTDIEVTIKKLKKQAEDLVKGAEIASHSQIVSEEKPSDTSQSDGDFRDNTKDENEFSHEETPVNQEPDLDNRPKTRRSSFEDDQSEGYRVNKFRCTPEEDQPEIGTSLEVLQEKLQTISEGTESTISTPKHATPTVMPIPKEVKCCGCNTDPVVNDYKEIQVDPPKTNVCIGTTAQTKHQPVQTDDNVRKKRLREEHNRALAIPPITRKLTRECFDGQGIAPDRKSLNRCEVTVLPVEEILPDPPKKDEHCARCLKQMKEEHTPGILIKSPCPKKKQLVIQKLPPITVSPGLTKTQVAYFAITSNGVTENFLNNSHNIRFIMTKDHSLMEEHFNKIHPHGQTPMSRSDSKLFLKIKESLLKTAALQKEPINETDRDRQMVYQSFLIYDNPNFHLPEPLDKRSKEKMSMMNLDVYKTYINPEGWSEGQEIPEYFFSKEVQCDIPSEKQTEEESVELSEEELGGFMAEGNETVLTKNSVAVQTSQMSDQRPSAHKNSNPEVYLEDYHSESVETPTIKKQRKSVKINSSPTEEILNEMKKTSKMSSKGVIAQGKISDHKPHLFQDKSTSMSYQNITAVETLPTQIEIPSPSDEGKENDGELSTFSEPMSLPNISNITQPVQQGDVTEKSFTSVKMHASSVRSKDTSKALQSNEEIELSQIFKEKDNLYGDIRGSTFIDVQNTPSDYSLPSEVTLTISYSTDSDESSVLQQVPDVREKQRVTKQNTEYELECIEYNSDQNLEEPPKMLTAKDMNTITKVKEKLRTLDTSMSNPILNLSQSMTQSGETVNTFIKGLTLVTTNSTNDPNAGRYKDEANLFAPNISLIPKRNHRTVLSGISGNKHLDNPRSKLLTLPKQLPRYSPDTSNSFSDTITTLSDGEIRCKHSISNGEVHLCNTKYSSNGGRPKRNVLSRTYDFYERARKHFEFSDKKIIVEERRNHFNNWVTYYIKAQERINDSSTSSCSNNK
ncbi:uncharacterized protein LOC143191481 isoform X3 [Rhynchophorus ferrugineus]|uniref:uncharacterized protein LOC143191481 isoform X3 n=1 Tax=Rhynchophorus ferrugineus TaxID=354439 RepID=UPI003FCCC2D1